MNYMDQQVNYKFTGGLSCGSSDSSLNAGQVTAVGAGTIGCFRGDHNAVLDVVWNNGKKSTVKVHFTDVLASLIGSGNVSDGEFAGQPVSMLLFFYSPEALNCAQAGIGDGLALRRDVDRRLIPLRESARPPSTPRWRQWCPERSTQEGTACRRSPGRCLGPRIGLRTEVASLAVTVAGVRLLTVGGAIHFDLGDALLHRAAHYIVALFFLNAVGTLVAVAGIALRIRGAWTLGALIAVPSIVLLIIAGTRGFPASTSAPSPRAPRSSASPPRPSTPCSGCGSPAATSGSESTYPAGFPTPPLHGAPRSRSWGPSRKCSMKAATRGSVGLWRESWFPQAVAITGAGWPG